MPNCSETGCDKPAVVQWSRRPTVAELVPLIDADNERRAEILASADPEGPAPVFGESYSAVNTVIAVYGCAAHGISLDLAPFVHQSACTAPNTANLPNCDCTPEPLTQTVPVQGGQSTLPAGW